MNQNNQTGEIERIAVYPDPDDISSYISSEKKTVIVFAAGRIVSRLDSIPFVGITKKNWAEFCAAFK